jgi:hypothetical protein
VSLKSACDTDIAKKRTRERIDGYLETISLGGTKYRTSFICPHRDNNGGYKHYEAQIVIQHYPIIFLSTFSRCSIGTWCDTNTEGNQ